MAPVTIDAAPENGAAFFVPGLFFVPDGDCDRHAYISP